MDTSRYQNGSIYKLCCKDPAITDCYVGSTCAFRNRKYAHKTCCNNENDKAYNRNVYQFIRDHGGWDNWEMIEIKKVNCETKRELEKEERAVLEQLGGTLNKSVPARSSVEYRETHKEEAKEYYEANKEEKKEKVKARYQKNKEELKKKFNCECGGRFTKQNKTTHIKSPKHQKYLNKIKE